MESDSTAPRADAVPEKSPAREPTESSTAIVAARRSPRKSLPLGSLSAFGYLAFARRPDGAARIGTPDPSSTTAEQVLNNEGRIARHSGGNRMPVAAEALRKLLQELNARTSAKMSAIVTRSRVPVAWVLPDDAQVDNFATMAATLLGALEVIYATMKANPPTHVTVESEGGILSVREVTGKMFFVAMAERRSPALVRAIDEVIAKAKGLTS